jgi:hypothetical protein
MPVAKDAESPCWGIEDIWFEDGVLMLGQTDDQGDPCSLIAEKIERCVPEDMLDKPAMVKIGVVDGDDDNRQIIDRDGDDATAYSVKSSVVKSMDDAIENNDSEDFDDDEYEWADDAFCTWVLEFN